MEFAAMLAKIGELAQATFTLTTIDAALRLQDEGVPADPVTRAAIEKAANAVLPGVLDGLDEQQRRTIRRLVTYQMKDIGDLRDHPHRGPGWAHEDPEMLHAFGDVSRQFVIDYGRLAETRPGLAEALRGRFLDVGTGIAGLALEAAARNPTLHVVGMDIWPPALALARANVAASPYADRVEIRDQDVTTLDEPSGFTLVWIAIPFMPKHVVEAALDRLAVALAPGGYLICPALAKTADAAGEALALLRLIRHGGHPWSHAEMASLLAARGFIDIEVAQGTSRPFHLARRPA